MVNIRCIVTERVDSIKVFLIPFPANLIIVEVSFTEVLDFSLICNKVTVIVKTINLKEIIFIITGFDFQVFVTEAISSTKDFISSHVEDRSDAHFTVAGSSCTENPITSLVDEVVVRATVTGISHVKHLLPLKHQVVI